MLNGSVFLCPLGQSCGSCRQRRWPSVACTFCPAELHAGYPLPLAGLPAADRSFPVRVVVEYSFPSSLHRPRAATRNKNVATTALLTTPLRFQNHLLSEQQCGIVTIRAWRKAVGPAITHSSDQNCRATNAAYAAMSILAPCDLFFPDHVHRLGSLDRSPRLLKRLRTPWLTRNPPSDCPLVLLGDVVHVP
jgi:hypothetical protein